MSEDSFTHLVYKLSSVEDALNRLAPAGDEIITNELAEYLDLARPTIPLAVPVVLELTGLELDLAQRQAVARGISAHYQLRLDETNEIIRSCWIKTFWFALCLIVSSALIFLSNNALNEVLVQYLYLPFWFFAYRVITFPLLDLQPVRRERKRLEHFLCMRVLFTARQADEGLSAYADGSPEFVTLPPSDFKVYRDATNENLPLECVVRGIGDLLHPASTPGREQISPEMASYLEHAEHFATGKRSVDLTVKGQRFTPEEQASIASAIRHYYYLWGGRLQQAQSALRRKIIAFAVLLVLSSAVLFCIGTVVDVAFHELLIIVLWFFGDYLIEFILIDNLGLRREQRACESLENLSLRFE